MKRIVALFFAAFMLAAFPAPAQQYKATDKVKLGGEGGWDYLTFDKEGQRLFITRGSHIMVVDTQSLKLTSDIADQSGLHGVALVPGLNRGFASNGGDDSVTIFDLKTLKVLDKVKVGTRPDAIIYDPFTKRVFTFNAKSQDSTALDAATGKVVGTVPLGGKPETPATDGKGTMYVNIEDKNEIAKFDPAKLTVLSRWPVAGCTEPSALAYDLQHQRLFAGCEKLMAVVDATSGKLVTTVPIGEGVDAGGFNPGTQEVFMSCGNGTLSVVHEDSPDKYSVKQTVETQRGARTMALDDSTNTIYTVTAEFDPAPPPPGQRRKMIPDTFTLIVVKAQ
jgi:YVTN family beta-propeller protein